MQSREKIERARRLAVALHAGAKAVNQEIDMAIHKSAYATLTWVLGHVPDPPGFDDVEAVEEHAAKLNSLLAK